MAHSISAAFTKEKTDELYTPPILVKPIIKHFDLWRNNFILQNNKQPIVLCPFDTDRSEFVSAFSKINNIELKIGHIETGQDFFIYDYGDYDICISNPPFSRKKQVYEKLLNNNKPFALVGNAMQINYEEIGRLFSDVNIQILSFDRRVSYNGSPSSFMSCYFCHDFLQRDLIFERLEHNNAKKKFTPSRMYFITA